MSLKQWKCHKISILEIWRGKKYRDADRDSPSCCCCFKSGLLYRSCLPHSWHLFYLIASSSTNFRLSWGPILSKCSEIFLHLTHLPFLAQTDFKSWKNCASFYPMISTARWNISFSSHISQKIFNAIFPSVGVFWKIYFWQWRVYLFVCFLWVFLHKKSFFPFLYAPGSSNLQPASAVPFYRFLIIRFYLFKEN